LPAFPIDRITGKCREKALEQYVQKFIRFEQECSSPDHDRVRVIERKNEKEGQQGAFHAERQRSEQNRKIVKFPIKIMKGVKPPAQRNNGGT
jgi:hypothetical protein